MHQELRFAACMALLLDLLVWVCSLFVIGFDIAVPLGLVLGTAGMLCNLWLLSRTIQNAVHHGKTQGFGGYLLRCAVSCGVIALGMCIPQINALAAILPFLYPKIIFGILSMRREKR